MSNIMIRNICNQNCIHCPNPQLIKRGVFKRTTDEEIIQQIDQAREKDNHINFTGGGEPTMNRKLPQLVRYAKKIGIESVSLETNGVLLSYPDYTRRLKESGLDSCIISLHSNKAQVSDTITQMKGGFGHTLEGIKNLREAGIRLNSILHTVSKYNYKDIVDFMRFCDEVLRIRDISFSFIRPMMDDKASEDITPTLSDIHPYLSEAFGYGKKKGFRVMMAASLGVPLCFMEGYEDFSGELVIYAREGEEEHKRISYAFEKVKGPQCARCGFDRCCSGVEGSYANLYGTSELRPHESDITPILKKIRSKYP
jgi:MoaA/NifB/PqqE/SkfB family radical SAM enzyme